MYFLHNRQGQKSKLIFLRLDLKLGKVSLVLKSSGKAFHIFGPKTEIVSSPLYTVFVCGTIKPSFDEGYNHLILFH